MSEAESDQHVTQGSIWIFAYGSLMFRPAFGLERRKAAFVEGYSRRFWQGSFDHRGVPGAPGRVVTLIEEVEARCHGVVYAVAGVERDVVLAALDRREQGGYERRSLRANLDDGREHWVEALTYVAPAGNRNYLGPASMHEIVRQIESARGPSGANDEYVLELARALHELGADDAHVFEIASRLRARRSIP